jgi:hypothetical protein
MPSAEILLLQLLGRARASSADSFLALYHRQYLPPTGTSGLLDKSFDCMVGRRSLIAPTDLLRGWRIKMAGPVTHPNWEVIRSRTLGHRAAN